MSFWVLFALPSAIGVLASGFKPENLAVVFGLAAWGVIWLWLWLRVIGSDHTGEVVGLVAMTILLSLFMIISPSPANTFLVFAFIVAGVCFPLRQAVGAMVALVLLQIALSVLRLADPAAALNSLINSILVGGLGIGARLFWESYSQLLAAREQLADAAVGEERLRFARDVHDILGQNLALLVLKSELVAKQLPPDTDESVRQEMRDIAQTARRSLNDVREAVAGYRQASLATEVSNARSALRSAGITFLVEDQAGTVAAEQDAVLAWCLREAVTNVVKHSSAAKCELRLSRTNGMVTMQVVDDGHGTTSLDGGSGLIGMRERVELVGGHVDVDSRDGDGLRLKVAVPVS